MFDLINLVKTGGYIGLSGIIFAESGLLIGFFLPGDSLLFTAGFLASQGYLSIWILLPLLFVSAILGDNVGYAFGRRAGPRLFNKQDSLLFHQNHLLKAKLFFEKHGGKTIILARFIPIVRTFAPVLAGVGAMKYRTFMVFNLIGAFLWAIGLTLLGYSLGSTIPGIDKYLLPIIALIVIISIAPTAIHLIRDKAFRDRIVGFIKKHIQ